MFFIKSESLVILQVVTTSVCCFKKLLHPANNNTMVEIRNTFVFIFKSLDYDTSL